MSVPAQQYFLEGTGYKLIERRQCCLEQRSEQGLLGSIPCSPTGSPQSSICQEIDQLLTIDVNNVFYNVAEDWCPPPVKAIFSTGSKRPINSKSARGQLPSADKVLCDLGQVTTLSLHFLMSKIGVTRCYLTGRVVKQALFVK